MRRAALALALVCGTAAAQPKPGAKPAGKPAPAVDTSATPVAVTPLRDSGLPPSEQDRLEKILIGAIMGIPGLRVANEKSGRLQAPKKSSAEARFAEDPTARALALGQEVKAPLAIAVDAAALGEGAVLYLQGVDVTKGTAIASTAYSVGAGAPNPDEVGGALLRVLQPDRYRGVLIVNVDVHGAQVLVDGQGQKGGPLTLSCGTHSLRVTHPNYREFLKFVTIDYGRPNRVDVALSKYPIEEAELRERERARRGLSGATGPLPWYQRWWVVGAAAVILLGAATGVAWGVTHTSVMSDLRITCCSF
jgi:PEGA domain